MQCPNCGNDTFTVGREVTLWQTLMIRLTDDLGSYEVEDDDLHDIVRSGEFVEATCTHCDGAVPLTMLFPVQKTARKK